MARGRMRQWQSFRVEATFSVRLRRAGGLYAFYDSEGGLLYIGSSGNIRSRVVSHLGDKVKRWPVALVKVSYMRGAWYRREQRLVRRIRPLLNKRITFRNRRDAN